MTTFAKKTLSVQSKAFGTALVLGSALLSGSALAHNNSNSINISSDSFIVQSLSACVKIE